MPDAARSRADGHDGESRAAERVQRLVRRAVRCARSQSWAPPTRGARETLAPEARPRDDRAGEAPVRAALRVTCASARAAGMRVEQLLILLKSTWSQQASRRVPRAEDHAVLARVVTLCIEEFYAASGADDATPHRPGA